MKTEYDPHNYSHIQQEQRDTLEPIVLDGKLDINNYIISVPPKKEVREDVKAWVDKEREREQTRSKTTNHLLTVFTASVFGVFVLVGSNSLIPNSGKELAKDLIPVILSSQITLLGVIVGFYFDKD
jgi:Ser-tRNA(Ala) deacylase AlaX